MEYLFCKFLSDCQENIAVSGEINSGWKSVKNYISISGIISDFQNNSDDITIYTKNDDIKNRFVFSYISEKRLIDVDKQIKKFEKNMA